MITFTSGSHDLLTQDHVVIFIAINLIGEKIMSLETGKTFAEFLKKNVSKAEDGKLTLTQKAFQQFKVEQGITKDIQEKLIEIDREISTGTVKYLADELKEDVQKLLKEGKKDEAAKASKSIRMAMPDGSRKMTVTASREFPAFNSVKYCYIDDNYKINRSLDKDVCESLAKEYADILGMKD